MFKKKEYRECGVCHRILEISEFWKRSQWSDTSNICKQDAKSVFKEYENAAKEKLKEMSDQLDPKKVKAPIPPFPLSRIQGIEESLADVVKRLNQIVRYDNVEISVNPLPKGKIKK